MEDAFIAVVEGRAARTRASAVADAISLASETAAPPGLVGKETRQVVRDPRSIAIGVVLPLILILLFGYGLSLDVKNVPVALVLEDPSPEASELAAGFQLSPYFGAVRRSMPRRRG